MGRQCLDRAARPPNATPPPARTPTPIRTTTTTKMGKKATDNRICGSSNVGLPGKTKHCSVNKSKTNTRNSYIATNASKKTPT